MWIKITMGYYYTSTRVAKIRKKRGGADIKSVSQNVNYSSYTLLVKVQTGITLGKLTASKNPWKFTFLIIQPPFCFYVYIYSVAMCTCLLKDMYKNVHRNTICNYQNMIHFFKVWVWFFWFKKYKFLD